MSAMLVYCTGVSASWCPICGNCSCPRDEEGNRGDLNHPDCDLHGKASKHGESQAPSVDEMLQLAFDRADDLGFYSQQLRERVAGLLKQLKIAGEWQGSAEGETRHYAHDGRQAGLVGREQPDVLGERWRARVYPPKGVGTYSLGSGFVSRAAARRAVDKALMDHNVVLVGGMEPCHLCGGTGQFRAGRTDYPCTQCAKETAP